ncbi:Phosphatidylinositol-glycan-specific phospholipase D [Myotis davidii]|uniref:Phosphatidylinositol-glycan-specific phospholipase D n=1 Tax=Myotis davidii TaxID=225400 RepID=L5LZ07_MYODS|nr:Phosphatidylinositol-glycan-specific phospholipase D [Myotis davidii]
MSNLLSSKLTVTPTKTHLTVPTMRGCSLDSTGQASSRFGSGLVTVRSQDKNQVVVAAERSSLGARLAGALHVYSLDSDWSPARVPAAPADAGRT